MKITVCEKLQKLSSAKIIKGTKSVKDVKTLSDYFGKTRMNWIIFIDGNKHVCSVGTVDGLTNMHSDDLLYYRIVFILVQIGFL